VVCSTPEQQAISERVCHMGMFDKVNEMKIADKIDEVTSKVPGMDTAGAEVEEAAEEATE